MGTIYLPIEFAKLYDMMEDYYFEDNLKNKDKEWFEHTLEKPEYKNTELFASIFC